MIVHFIKSGFPIILAAALAGFPEAASPAGEVDFSCMSHRVWDKGHVSDQRQTHDIVLKNDCPGPVYWSMCIERVNPWSGKVLETLNPVGYVETGQKARVNLRVKKASEKQRFRNRFQGFYVNFGYGIDETSDASCHAARCEAKKSGLRAEARSNEAAWKASIQTWAARIDSQCPDNGWDTEEHKQCVAGAEEEKKADMQIFILQEQEIREKLAAIDPEHCQVHSGDLVDD
jgi:hypothetical protein